MWGRQRSIRDGHTSAGSRRGRGGAMLGNGETQKRTVRKGICSEEGEKGTRQRQQQRQRQRQR